MPIDEVLEKLPNSPKNKVQKVEDKPEITEYERKRRAINRKYLKRNSALVCLGLTGIFVAYSAGSAIHHKGSSIQNNNKYKQSISVVLYEDLTDRLEDSKGRLKEYKARYEYGGYTNILELRDRNAYTNDELLQKITGLTDSITTMDSLKTKSINEEDYRYYWQKNFDGSALKFLGWFLGIVGSVASGIATLCYLEQIDFKRDEELSDLSKSFRNLNTP